MKSLALRLAVLALPALGLVACDSLGIGGGSKVSVSFAVPKAGNADISAAVVAADPVTLNGHTLDLQSVDVTFSKIQLDRHEDAMNMDDDNELDEDGEDSPDDEEIKVGETTIALPLNGGLITPIDAPIPPGDYESIEMKVSSVRLRGTYDGQAFDVNVPVHVELENEFNPPFHIATDTDQLNVTVQVNVAQWLQVNGTLIDPRQLATNDTLRHQVVHQIRASFKSFEDHDHDGDDDHDGNDD